MGSWSLLGMLDNCWLFRFDDCAGSLGVVLELLLSFCLRVCIYCCSISFRTYCPLSIWMFYRFSAPYWEIYWSTLVSAILSRLEIISVGSELGLALSFVFWPCSIFFLILSSRISSWNWFVISFRTSSWFFSRLACSKCEMKFTWGGILCLLSRMATCWFCWTYLSAYSLPSLSATCFTSCIYSS